MIQKKAKNEDQGTPGGMGEKRVSDRFYEAVKELDGCLKDKIFAHIIDGELRTEIQKLRDRMERMRININTSFHWEGSGRSGPENRDKFNVA